MTQIEKKSLPVLMFLLIYSPKIGGKIDSLSAFCFLTLLWSLLRSNYKPKIPEYLSRPVSIFMLFACVMLIYSLFLLAIYGLSDTYQIMRFSRIILNILGILGLTSLYYLYYKEDLGRVLLYHLWLCIVSHAVLMLLMFFIPAVNEFVLTQLVQMDESNRAFDSRMAGNRIGGLTGSWDATSGIQSLGILMLPFVLNYVESGIKRNLVYLSIPVSLMAIFLSGVTGLVNISLIGFLFFVFHFSEIKKYIPHFIITVAIILLLGGAVFTYLVNNNKDLIVETSIGRTVFMITQNDEFSTHSKRGNTASETIKQIGTEMYFLPTDDRSLFFGMGGSGRSNDYRIKADPGPTLNLHNLGIFFVLILYSYCFGMIIKSFKSSKINLYMGMAITAVLCTIIFIDAKVSYLLARQSLSIMLVAYFSLFWILKMGRSSGKYVN